MLITIIIVIQRLTGENFIVPVAEGHTIAQVKAVIHAQKGIHPSEQWLLHEGQTLEDKHVLQERARCAYQFSHPCSSSRSTISGSMPQSGSKSSIPMI